MADTDRLQESVMRLRPSKEWGLFLLLSVTLAGFLYGDRDRDAGPDRFAGLIEQLGDRKFARREEASKKLEEAGEKALPALRKAAVNSRDLEIRRRAREVVRRIMLAGCKSKSTGLELVPIEAGEFQMGSPFLERDRRGDESQHRVRITTPFVLGAYEVTQDEYQQVMKSMPSWFSSKGTGKDKVAGQKTGRFPVDTVTWYDGIEFCNRLSKQDGYEPYYKMTDAKRIMDSIKNAKVTIVGGNGYRLPTEAEWEYACRAGSTTVYHFGDATRSGLINCKPLLVAAGYGSAPKWPDLERTARVGSHEPNAWGLHDMHGNVGEWCWDRYDRQYYARSPRDDPAGPDEGNHRVLRGGSWLVSEGSCRSASRFFHTPDESNYTGGFRIARTPAP
jgi:formylglycine-generating enzyme required for sulfatase activity